MLKKLRYKFVLMSMGIFAVMLLVIFCLIYHFTKVDLEQQNISALKTLMQQNGDWKVPNPDVQLPYFTVRVNVWGDASISGNAVPEMQDEALLQELVRIACSAAVSTGYIPDYEMLFGRTTFPGGQNLVFVDISVQQAALRSLVEKGVLIGLLSLCAFAGISILLARWAVKPVARAWEQQKQFISDASHELKTPLTVIMSNAELLREDAGESQDTLRFSENILTMTKHMRTLVEGLLELARADNNQIHTSFSSVAYSQLVSDTVLLFEPVLYEKGLLLKTEVESGISLTGSQQHLHQVVEILLDNAGKYTSSGVITVALRRQGRGQCLLTVANPGEPIPRGELERIFDRFYRSDKARSRSGSFGLGLAIAKSVVQTHGGKIWAQSNATGNCFFVQLPCDSQT